MNGFKKNRVCYDYETVGEQLSFSRQKQNLSLKKVSKKLNINPEYLEALESGNYKKLPEGVYRKKILKKYCEFLKLDSEKVKKTFFKEKEVMSPDLSKLPILNKIKAHNFIILPKFIKNGLILLLILVCFGYLGYYLSQVISPPDLFIKTPSKNNLTVSEKQIEIIGQTHPEAKVFINNKNILKENSGNFSQNINLKEGLNTITISAKKKYSRLNVIKKQIMVQ